VEMTQGQIGVWGRGGHGVWQKDWVWTDDGKEGGGATHMWGGRSVEKGKWNDEGEKDAGGGGGDGSKRKRKNVWVGVRLSEGEKQREKVGGGGNV